MLETIQTLIEMGAVIIATCVGVWGLTTWRSEMLGRRKAELAEEVLCGFYEAKDIFGWARFPGSYGGEGETRTPQAGETEDEKSYRNTLFVPIERLHKNSEFFSKLQSLRYRFIAYFGREAAEPFDKIKQVHSRITISSRMLVTTFNRRQNEEREDLRAQRYRWESDIGWWTEEAEDTLTPMINEAVDAMERTCKPYLSEGKK